MASRFVGPAEKWLRANARGRAVSTKVFWRGLQESDPELTKATPERKTPRTTCMRDLRNDSRFVVANGMIALRRSPPQDAVGGG